MALGLLERRGGAPVQRIGNDIVDLDAPAIAADPVRPRFVARTCCASEVLRVEQAADPALVLWSLFAAKEAAYKALVKLEPELVFAHRLFEVSEDFTCVRHQGRGARLWLARGDGWVHAVAVTNASEHMVCPPWWMDEAREGEGLSDGVRRLLRSSMAPRLGCDASDLHVLRAERPGSWSGLAPPRLARGETDTGIDISLSHDGRFVAAAALQADAALA